MVLRFHYGVNCAGSSVDVFRFQSAGTWHLEPWQAGDKLEKSNPKTRPVMNGNETATVTKHVGTLQIHSNPNYHTMSMTGSAGDGAFARSLPLLLKDQLDP